MKNKMISNKKVEELQKISDDFARRKNSKVGFKILAGIMAGVSALTLVGCSDIKDDKAAQSLGVNYELKNTIQYENVFANHEKGFEQELVEFLNNETGLEINLINMKDVKIVSNEEGNYLVIEGEMITDIIEGSKNCAVTLEISDSQLEAAQEYMKSYEYFVNLGGGDGGVTNLVNEDVVSLRFVPKFIEGLKTTLQDKDTKVVGIYNKDSKETLYNRDSTGR